VIGVLLIAGNQSKINDADNWIESVREEADSRTKFCFAFLRLFFGSPKSNVLVDAWLS
jgi:hypothetical protein